MSMIDRLLRRRPSSANNSNALASPNTNSSSPTNARSFFTHLRPIMPYDTPDSSGRCFVLDLPDEVLSKVFQKLDRVTMARCYRVCKRFTDLLSHSDLALLHLLQINSLRLNPHSITPSSANITQIPPSKSQLLSILRERITRFRHFTPSSTTRIKFQESEGRLYEYLEGVLLRNVPTVNRRERGRDVAIYELDKLNDWEDLPSSPKSQAGQRGEQDRGDDNVEIVETGEDDEAATLDVRRSKKFNFDILDFAVDPGMDLFVLAEQRRTTARTFSMYFHLLTLSTFEPHPRAAQHILKWPAALIHSETSLGFQICDDGLYVLRNNTRGAAPDHLCGWQWTTGRLAVTIKAPPVTTFESFILLTPSSFVIPSVATRIRPDSDIQDNLGDPRDLEFSLHLQLYAFPPFSAVPWSPGEGSGPAPPPHTAINIATIDLPTFVVDFDRDLPPPRMTIRTDPPPRHEFPTHPLISPAPFVPEPESGVVIIDFHCQPFNPPPHFARFVLFTLKTTLMSYLPAPTSPLLFQAFPRPAPVVSWDMIAPKVRMIGPLRLQLSWVCYVYQYRYVIPAEDTAYPTIRLYNFDPIQIRRELSQRKNEKFPNGLKGDGEIDGITIITPETVLPAKAHLANEVRTGRDFPYMFTDKRWKDDVDNVVIDGHRIVAFESEEDREYMHVMEF